MITTLIAVVVVYIAWQQYKIEHDKLRLAFYDRRLKVFGGLMDLFTTILQSGEVSDEMWNKYKNGTVEAPFLFDSEISDYKKTVDRKALELLFIGDTWKNLPPGEEKDAKAKKIDELRNWFKEQGIVTQNKFEKCLKFELISHSNPLTCLLSSTFRYFRSLVEKLWTKMNTKLKKISKKNK